MKKKALVIGIIFLFIGIAVAPSVTSIEFSKTKTSNSNDLVEITLQLCKTSGVEDHKMYITQEQNDHLDRLIESFRADLNNTETREETIEIYKDMVVSLDKYGLIPDEMTIKEAQELVTYGFNKHGSSKDKTFESKKLGEDENAFCLTAGDITQSWGQGPTLTLFAILFWSLYKMFNNLRELLLTLMSINPLSIGYTIGIGAICYGEPGEPDYLPALGWVFTIGLNGIKSWNEKFYGQLPLPLIKFVVCQYFPGITGFTGIKIQFIDYIPFFFGTALKVKIGESRPNCY